MINLITSDIWSSENNSMFTMWFQASVIFIWNICMLIMTDEAAIHQNYVKKIIVYDFVVVSKLQELLVTMTKCY